MMPLLKAILTISVLQLLTVALCFPDCKCAPGDDCWPSEHEWNSFNQTLNGQLIQARPPGSVCYRTEPDYNEDACEEILANWTLSTFHLQDPVSVAFPSWAEHPCSPIYPNGTSIGGDPHAGERGCSIGKYPVYVVNATGTEDIATAVRWAKKRNIRLNVKNTGHSHLGRSTGYGSLSIWTHNLRGIDYHENFQYNSCQLQSGDGSQMAVTIAAGMVTLDALDAMREHDIAIVTGANPTVGVMGWFPGGGHGMLSSTYGMGSDNVLEATVVTMDGSVVTTNPCHHPELFYAIRGGGAGTYGIITSVVMKAYPSPRTTVWNLQAPLVDPSAEPEFYDLLAWFHSDLARLKEGGLQGYHMLLGPPVMETLTYTVTFMAYDKPNGTVEALARPFLQRLEEMGDAVQYNSEIATHRHYHEAFRPDVTAEPVAPGGAAMGGRLLPKGSLKDPERLYNLFRQIGPTMDPNVTTASTVLLGHMIANSGNVDLETALNPAWREAVTHFIIARGWEESTSKDVQEDIQHDVTFNKTAALRSLAPDSGSYFNEMDVNEPDWQYAAFGENYPRLKAIKDKYDPEGLLYCVHCVGSESWEESDEGRLCRPDWWKRLNKR